MKNLITLLTLVFCVYSCQDDPCVEQPIVKRCIVRMTGDTTYRVADKLRTCDSLKQVHLRDLKIWVNRDSISFDRRCFGNPTH